VKTRVAGLDVGGANVKVSAPDGAAACRPFELWRAPERLSGELAALLEPVLPLDLLAVTMTGEICDCFASKEDGVRRILEGVAVAARELRPEPRVVVWRNDRRFVPLPEALLDPLPAAAANWLAIARLAGRFAPRGPAILIDVGSTTADIVPLEDGEPVPRGLTDTDRLLAGELVYTGVERTPIAALLREAPYRGDACPVAAEVFATSRDAWLMLGLAREDTSDRRTADGMPATREHARRRLARMICADPGSFAESDAIAFAGAAAEEQTERVRSGIARVISSRRQPEVVVLSGSGELLGALAAADLGAREVRLSRELGEEVSTAAAAHALRVLAAE
jgi:probable H4MPT-linked C1 transfer pathway protein